MFPIKNIESMVLAASPEELVALGHYFLEAVTRILIETRIGPKLLTPEEVGERLGYKAETVLAKAKAGEIGCIRDTGYVMFRREHIEEFIAAREHKAARPLEAYSQRQRGV